MYASMLYVYMYAKEVRQKTASSKSIVVFCLSENSTTTSLTNHRLKMKEPIISDPISFSIDSIYKLM